MTVQDFDLIVIGAGPAGMAAAVEAAGRGLAVRLLDEQSGPGGQIYRATQRTPLGPNASEILGSEYGRGEKLASALAGSTVSTVRSATVIEVRADGWVGYETGGRISYIRGRKILIATGAQERPSPFPGWTLPGVMTVGAAQILLKSAAMLPSDNGIVAGSGPLVYLFAWQMLQAGMRPKAVLDTTPAGNYRRALPHLPKALRRSAYLVKGFRLIAAIRRSGVPFIRNVSGLVAEGDQRIEKVAFETGGKVRTIDTDLLLVHQGVVPNIQLTQSLRCEHVWDDSQLCFRPKLDEFGMTSRDGIYVAGDGSGIGGAIAAEMAGRLAAMAIDASLKGSTPGAEWQALKADHERESAVRPFLEALYRPAGASEIADETIVCRCEEATAGHIREAVRLGCSGPNQLKAFLRAGMGPCQGRMCGLTVSQLMAAELKSTPRAVGYYRLRAPVKPVTLGQLAEMQIPEPEAPPHDQQAESGEENRHPIPV
ncbi:FAD/NAD(P)-dependent oxidoreductase [Rhizobium binxianense]